MRLFVLAALLAASTSWAQQATPQPPQPLSTSEAQSATPAQNGTLTLPAGTRIPLTLASPITYKARPGDPVRATVAFPVTLGTQLAIPAGAYMEGSIAKLTKRIRPSVQIHFTSLVYANGYTVPINGTNIEAKVIGPAANPAGVSAFAPGDSPNYAFAAQTGPMPPPLPPQPSHVGVIVGFVVAAVVAIVTTILLARHRGRSNGVLFDTGWQLDMVLQNPLVLNEARAAAATAP
ncbi:MAG TPA: hypothetical protein VNF00_00885 [Candidatus Acidoferrales bacterium]|nr:hypothetical protein [Candidatus Acidoferrales bacterium]